MGNLHIEEAIANQQRAINQVHLDCFNRYGMNMSTPDFNPFATYSDPGTHETLCPPFFDTIYCWPPQQPNTTASVQCPSYIIGFPQEEFLTRHCDSNGKWATVDNHTYSNYTACSKEKTVTVFTNLTTENNEILLSTEAVKLVKLISEIGYGVSLASLIIAFTIMFKIKKLHCARNILHMNLFASFILRAFIVILKGLLFEDGLGLAQDFIEENGEVFFHVDATKNNFECKLIVSIGQYFTAANYSWILMEGLYLNNLVLRALFTDTNRNLIYYILFGWGLPVLVVVPWVIARILVEDRFCWTTHDNPNVFAIILVPTFASCLLNLILFIIISAVLYKKLKSPVCEDSRRYLKWAKSTLVLVPLFGVNYGVLLILYFLNEKSIWMICNSIFGSFQGFFVAVLYCFLNGEVKAEIKPYISSVLIFLATNNVTKYCFPKREKYLSSAVGRQSVCTTMSCSSLYNNVVSSHRNSRTKFEQLTKPKCTDNINYGARHSKCGTNGHYVPNLSFVHGRYPNMNTATTNVDLPMMNDAKPHYYSQNLPTCEEEVSMLEQDDTTLKRPINV